MVAPGVPVDAVAVDVGKVHVGFVGVGAAGIASSPIPGTVSVLVGGTWGVPAPPSLVSATASNTGRAAGFNSGDTLALVSIAPFRRCRLTLTSMKCSPYVRWCFLPVW